MNSAPSSEPDAWEWDVERIRHPSLVAAVGVVLTPALSVGASWNRGPWMRELASGAYPAGRDQWDYVQSITAVDVAWARGGVVVRAEAMRDRWEVPNTGSAPGSWTSARCVPVARPGQGRPRNGTTTCAGTRDRPGTG